MALVTNSVTTYGTPTKREDLVNAIYRIDPEDTPFTNSIPRVKATAVLHEWSNQALQTVNTTNARLEGDALTRASATTPTRVTNYCQISSKDATVTGTERAVSIAGSTGLALERQAGSRCCSEVAWTTGNGSPSSCSRAR